MKKRIPALALAVIMILSSLLMSACSKDPDLPPSGDSATNQAGGTTAGSGDKKDETDPPETTDDNAGTNSDGLLLEYFDNYIPNPDAKYTGKVGVSGSGVSFDKLTVRDGNNDMYVNDFEESSTLPESAFSVFGGALSDWTVKEDTSSDKANKMLVYSGSDESKLIMGNTLWGPYRLVVSLLLEESGKAEVYFCVKDEKNYYRLTVTGSAEGGVMLEEVKDGNATTLSKLPLAQEVGSWFNVSANIEVDKITVYVAGTELFHVGGDAAAHTYTGYLGLGQWQTELYFDNIVVENPETGEVYYTQDFEDGTFLDNAVYGLRNNGNWSIANSSDWEIVELEDGNHVLHFKSSSVYGAAVLFDANLPEDCTSYRYKYDGYVVTGGEGPQCIYEWNIDTMDESTHLGNDYFCFDVGGWSGQCAIQEIIGGTKNNIQNYASIGLETQTWQTVEILAYPDAVLGYFDGNFVQIYMW